MKTQTKELDFKARYRVAGWNGVAFFLRGYATTQDAVMYYFTNEAGEQDEAESGEYETVEDRDHVIAVMVGDDRKRKVSVDDLTVLEEEDYCHVCGQIGCRHDGI